MLTSMDHDSSRSPAKAKALKLAGTITLIAGLLVGFVNPLLAIIPCYIAYLLLRRGKKYTVKIGDSVLKDDDRPPVLYLRSFKDEDLDSSVFHRFKNLASSDKTWLAATVPNNGVQEQDALGYIFRKIGPYIALGKPAKNFQNWVRPSSTLLMTNGRMPFVPSLRSPDLSSSGQALQKV
jgi:hypothetical protein